MLPSSRGPAYDEITRRKSAYRVNSVANKEYDFIPMVDPYESVFNGGSLKLPTNATTYEKENWHINRLLGRRFKATSIRWLNANEI
jgi:branched-subunit amino acid aminotransferase/4-amino-4-deoxychorismate lyase